MTPHPSQASSQKLTVQTPSSHIPHIQKSRCSKTHCLIETFYQTHGNAYSKPPHLTYICIEQLVTKTVGWNPVTIMRAMACLTGLRARWCEHCWKMWEKVFHLVGVVWFGTTVVNGEKGTVLYRGDDKEQKSLINRKWRGCNHSNEWLFFWVCWMIVYLFWVKCFSFI